MDEKGNRLFRNDGDKFVDVSRDTRIGEIAHMGLSANWWDYNDDGLLDFVLFDPQSFEAPVQIGRNLGVLPNSKTNSD